MNIDLDYLNFEDQSLYNDLSIEVQTEFNLLSEKILYENDNNVFLFSTLCSRNPYQSKLFILCLELFFIKTKIAAANDQFSFFNCSLELSYILKDKFPKHIFSFKTHFSDTYLLRILKDIFHNLKFTINSILSKSDKRKNIIINNNLNLILIDSFVMKKSIVTGLFFDRYYNKMLSYIDVTHQNKIYYIPHLCTDFNKKSLDKLSENSNENLLFKNDFLDYRDYLYCLKILFSTKYFKSKIYFYEFDFSDLLSKLHNKNKFNHSSYRALLNYSFIRKLRNEKIDIDLLIDWNENQPIDKGLIKGVKDFFKNTVVKGYQGYIVSRKYNFYTIPTEYEVKKNVIPDEIIVIGDKLKHHFNNLTKLISISTGPAFRFLNYNINFNPSPSFITIVLPIGINESYNLINELSKCFKNNLFGKYEIIFKPHPTINVEQLKKKLNKNNINYFNFFNGQFKDILTNSILILGNTSSALMESIVNGVPVIIIPQPYEITQNPIPENIDDKLVKICNNYLELNTFINTYVNLTYEERKLNFNLGKGYKSLYYLNPTKENVSNFLNIK